VQEKLEKLEEIGEQASDSPMTARVLDVPMPIVQLPKDTKATWLHGLPPVELVPEETSEKKVENPLESLSQMVTMFSFFFDVVIFFLCVKKNKNKETLCV